MGSGRGQNRRVKVTRNQKAPSGDSANGVYEKTRAEVANLLASITTEAELEEVLFFIERSMQQDLTVNDKLRSEAEDLKSLDSLIAWVSLTSDTVSSFYNNQRSLA